MQQLMAHWMFEMVAGFDVFNEWYDAEPETEDVSTYVVVEQSNNQLRISSYKLINHPRWARVTVGSPSTASGLVTTIF